MTIPVPAGTALQIEGIADWRFIGWLVGEGQADDNERLLLARVVQPGLFDEPET